MEICSKCGKTIALEYYELKVIKKVFKEGKFIEMPIKFEIVCEGCLGG